MPSSRSTTTGWLAVDKRSKNDRTGQHDKPEASTTSSSPGEDDDITTGMNAPSPKWFAKNVRQLCDRAVGRPCRYRETVRSETAIPRFNNSLWIRGAPPEVILRGPYAESDRDTLNRCAVFQRLERRCQYRRSPARCQRSTVEAVELPKKCARPTSGSANSVKGGASLRADGGLRASAVSLGRRPDDENRTWCVPHD